MSKRSRSGLSLVELLVVLVILVALAGMLVPMFSNTTQEAQGTATRANLQNLATTIARYRADNNGQLPAPGPAGIAAGRPAHPQIRYLFINPGTSTSDTTSETAIPSYNPFTKIGWNGPYVIGGAGTYPNPASTTVSSQGFSTIFGNNGDPCVLDGWNNPIVLIQFTDSVGVTHAWLQSAGPDRVLDISYSSTGVPMVA